MNNIIREIIGRKCSTEEKNEAFDKLEEDIKIGRGILTGRFKYCPKCDDYYLTESYTSRTESICSMICTFEDPINSGGNEYEDGYLDITYSICPKGHEEEIRRMERLKRES